MNAKIENINGITNITKKKGVPLKILQLTDIHIGGSFSTRKKTSLRFKRLKNRERFGRRFRHRNGRYGVPHSLAFAGQFQQPQIQQKIRRLYGKLGKPWTVVFGNHDSEVWATASKKKIGDFYSSCKIVIFPAATKT